MKPSFSVPKTKRSFDRFHRLGLVHPPPTDNSTRDISEEVDRLDEEMMMTLVLDCMAALAEKQRVRVALKKPLKTKTNGEPLSPEQQASRNKVFKAALGLLAEGLTHDGNGGSSSSSSGGIDAVGGDECNTAAAVRELASAFPSAAKLKDGRGWLPLHWAVVAVSSAAGAGSWQYDVTEADVKAVYSMDPLALCRHHLKKEAGSYCVTEALLVRCGRYYGFTPSHLLCMGALTEQTKSLVRYFSVSSPRSFTMDVRYHIRNGNDVTEPEFTCGALHVACRFGQPTEWLLQHLLQLDSSAYKRRSFVDFLTPLSAWCEFNMIGRVDERALRCLLAADSNSAEVVYNSIRGCLSSEVLTKRMDVVTLLLEANPQAAHHADGETLVHVACRSSGHMSAKECIDVLKLLLAANKDALKIADDGDDGLLPMHVLARDGPVEALEYLLDAYPEVLATTLTTESESLLHCVASCRSASKARLLCSRYPAMMLQRNNRGQTPLHVAIYPVWSFEADVLLALLEAGGRELASAPVGHLTDEVWNEGLLPLYKLISYTFNKSVPRAPVSPWADVFRLLLCLYPEAAGVEFDEGEDVKTPYHLAIERGLPEYFRRLLLRAAPDLDPEELRRLNWAERRQAMFLAFRALSATQPLLARLRYENKDLVKNVLSFL